MNIRNVVVQDRNSPHHGLAVDLIIEKGMIKVITKHEGGEKSHKVVSPGLMDLSSHFNDPGVEHKEDLFSGPKTAMLGGFTDVCILPNTLPPIDNRSTLEYILAKTAAQVTSIHPYGALSAGLKGEQLSEIFDLKAAGAIAFTDGLNPVINSELLLKGLQYVQKFDGLIISRPRDGSLSPGGQMNEGEMSTRLGLPGISNLSEKAMIERDLSILEYAGGRLHIHAISAAESIDLIAKAKQKGLKVTCDVALYQLLYLDEDLNDFDTVYKVDPPLRTQEDALALKNGLLSGTIDAISIDHRPQDEESKNLEFDLADFGMIGLQTAFSSLLKLASESLPLELLLMKLSNGPRSIFNMPIAHITEGVPARLAVFDIGESWTYDKKSNASKSTNSPLLGKELVGKTVAVINGEKSYFA
jgi:dihydroorotase